MDHFQCHAQCHILKAIHAGVGWVWLARLAVPFENPVKNSKSMTSMVLLIKIALSKRRLAIPNSVLHTRSPEFASSVYRVNQKQTSEWRSRTGVCGFVSMKLFASSEYFCRNSHGGLQCGMP